ncbi:PREDICTED: uncharacterized protein LOC109469344 isoform X2 [Branchiostoma belcheri]|uniref:Uncharacterized protein LOC109469344 isoform X2 n=2 Tax=Branchiostoma belcheri TaxID=7741 RepID=A0A6P4Z1G0_BRABE|nr:PREDICTED: uncharacterized protein LOC109469344 isoform X2 [Branchiostoma belcheri]
MLCICTGMERFLRSSGKSPGKTKVVKKKRHREAWSRKETRALIQFCSLPCEGCWDPTVSEGWPGTKSSQFWSKAVKYVRQHGESTTLRTETAVRSHVNKYLNARYPECDGGRLAAEKAFCDPVPGCSTTPDPVSPDSFNLDLPRTPASPCSHSSLLGNPLSSTPMDFSTVSHSTLLESPIPTPMDFSTCTVSHSTLLGSPLSSTPMNSTTIPGRRNVATQTGEDEEEKVMSSTPIKGKNPMDMSFTPSSTYSTPGKKDVSWYPDSDHQSSSDDEAEDLCQIAEEECSLDGKRFIVFGEKLKELFENCRNPECGRPTLIKSTTKGSALSITQTCPKCPPRTWRSQPYDKRMARGNLLIPSAILFTGGSISKFIDFADALQLQVFSQKHFFNIQSHYAMPVVDEYYLYQQDLALDLCRGGPVDVIGDGRCDSPGHCAKYLSYTLMEETTGLILELVQVTETGTSQSMEKEGLDRCLTFLTDPEGQDIDVQCVTTDRHRGVGALMKKEYRDIDHQFDVFHVYKNVKKKLCGKAKLKDCAELTEWTKSICNHLWWCAKTCGGNAECLREKWTSIMNHTTNVHSWSGNQFFHACKHKQATQRQEETTTKWLKVDSPPHKALKAVVFEKALLRDMGQMTKYKHTGQLEVYHNVVLKYAPKRLQYPYPGMRARLQLSVIDHNENIGRTQAKTSRGDLRHRLDYSKRQKRFAIKTVYERKDYTFRQKLMEAVLQRRQDGEVRPMRRRLDLPANIAPVPRPDKAEALALHRSRFADRERHT